MSQKPPLRACPFCGRIAAVLRLHVDEDSRGRMQIVCAYCGARGPYADATQARNELDAAERWNGRA